MYEKFLYLLEVNEVTTYRVAKETGISQTLFTNWKQGRSEPKLSTLQKIAKYFGVGVEYFLNQICERTLKTEYAYYCDVEQSTGKMS